MMRRNGWRTVSLGDVAMQVSKHVQDPLAEGVERFVGLDHLDPEHIRVERWGSVAEGTTFTKRFEAGQLLFARRRAYQRKAAVANFDGVCSGDIIVIEADPDLLLPELLPYLIHNDRFLDLALKTSAGSLSPRTKWKDVAKYEFDLPPLDRQGEIVDVLRAANDLASRAIEVERTVDLLIGSTVAEHYSRALASTTMVRVGDVGEVLMGRQKAPRFRLGNNPRPFLTVANIGYLELKLGELEEMDFTPADLKRFRLLEGDVLLSEGDLISPANVGRPALVRTDLDGIAFQNTLIRFRAGPLVKPEYALLAFEGARQRGEFARVAGRTTVTHLGLDRFCSVSIPVPDLDIQQAAAGAIRVLVHSRDRARRHAAACRAVLASLSREFLS